VVTSGDGRRVELDAVRHPSRGNRRAAAPPALVRDIDRILLDHGIDLPKADIKGRPGVATERQLRRSDRWPYKLLVASLCVEGARGAAVGLVSPD
jgi:hypothetical protein